LYVPLGSPFAGLKEGERLEDLIGPNKIKEMMNNDTSGSDAGKALIIYDVSETMAQSHGIEQNTQTYLVQYPLTEMPLNLETYLNDAMNNTNDTEDIRIPEIPGIASLPAGMYYYIYGDGSVPGTSEVANKPFLKIPLDDMTKLVKEVTRDADGRFGLEISYTPQFAQNLELKIPAFGINTYIKGTPDSSVSPTKLLYVDKSGTDFVPRTALGDNSELWIYVRVSGPCAGLFEPSLLFEWKKAVIYASAAGGDNDFKTEYPIENSLGDFLGGGVSFKKADGYVYMSGLHSDSSTGIELKVDIGGATQTRYLQEAEPSFTVTTKPDDTKVVDGSLTNSSFIGANTNPLDLTPIFESAGAVLKVEIKIEEIEIENSPDLGDKSVKISLYALIPLNLKVSEVAGKEAPNVTVGGVDIRNTYVPLDLGDTLAKMGDGDLFGREEGGDNLINEIDFVELNLKGVNISIIEKNNLMLLVKTKNDYKLLELKNNAALKFDSGLLSYPFSPEFSVLLKKDTGTSGSIKILRTDAPKFDFMLDVKAKAKIDYTLKF